MGVFVSSLQQVDTRAGQFGADLWLWSNCPGDRNAVSSLDFVAAASNSATLPWSQTANGSTWSTVKQVGVFRQSFDLRNFPFDRHTLRVAIEEGTDEVNLLDYRADTARSRLRRDLSIPGWRVGEMRVRAAPAFYNTTFGDVTQPPNASSRYAHLDVEVDIRRDAPGTFLKLTAPLYLAALLALMTFLMQVDAGSFLNPRLALLAGLLFAVVFNMRSVDDAIGAAQGMSLLDAVHLAALGVIAVATAAAAAWSSLYARGWDEQRIRRWDLRLLAVTGVGYVVINVVLITSAIAAG